MSSFGAAPESFSTLAKGFAAFFLGAAAAPFFCGGVVDIEESCSDKPPPSDDSFSVSALAFFLEDFAGAFMLSFVCVNFFGGALEAAGFLDFWE